LKLHINRLRNTPNLKINDRFTNLAKLPELERHYRPALAAMDRAFEKSGADDSEVVVKAVISALLEGKAKPRTVVGKGTGALMMLSRFPIGLRDKLVKIALEA
jgi:hypothetical protein